MADGFDPCECVWNHEHAMQRLINLVSVYDCNAIDIYICFHACFTSFDIQLIVVVKGCVACIHFKIYAK